MRRYDAICVDLGPDLTKQVSVSQAFLAMTHFQCQHLEGQLLACDKILGFLRSLWVFKQRILYLAHAVEYLSKDVLEKVA